MAKPQTGPMDLPFLVLVFLLSGIGLVMMFSASYAWGAGNPRLGPMFYVTRQGLFMVTGIFVMLLVSRFNHDSFRFLSLPTMALAIILLVLVLFVGSREAGAVRWINLGPINIQPSEIAKIAVIMFFATMMAAYPEKLAQKRLFPFLRGIFPYILVLGVVLGLIARQPHVSGIILIFSVSAVMLFMGGIPYRWIALVGGMGIAGITAVIRFTSYAATRIEIWRDPWSDIRGGGWQTVQSLYAIASGGWFGVGLGQSRQKYNYLPEPHNDFVFAIVAEELGLIGALGILFLFVLLICRGYWIALHTRDRYGSLLASGVTTMLAIQTLLNVAVVTNLIPVTGISMPFFSYGGSSLLILMAQMGIILSVSRRLPGKM